MCSICLEPFGGRESRAREAYQCKHRICVGCDRQMRENRLHTCPECRACRKGMTLEQIEEIRRADRLARMQQTEVQAALFRVVEIMSMMDTPTLLQNMNDSANFAEFIRLITPSIVRGGGIFDRLPPERLALMQVRILRLEL